MIPVLPKNQQKPMKRIMDRKAVAYNRTLKNQAVRAVEFDCDHQLARSPESSKMGMIVTYADTETIKVL